MIKRFLTLLLLVAAGIPAGLAEDPVLVLPDQSFYLMPAELSKDGKAFLYNYLREGGETNITRFLVYDDDFQLVKEFTTVPGTPNAYSYQIQERERIPVSATIYREETYDREALSIDGVSEGLTVEAVLNFLNQHHILDVEWEIRTMEDGTQVVAITSTYYQEEYFGKKYPLHVYKEVDGLWYYYHISYDTIYGPYGEWKEAETRSSDGEYPYPIDLKIVPLDGSDEEWYELTRGVFSEDFCYVLPIYQKVEFSKEYTYEATDWVYRKEWGYRYKIRAYSVYDSSSKIVVTFEAPEGYDATDNMKYIRLSNKRYILVGLQKAGIQYDDYFTAIYRLDEDNKVTQVAIAPSTKVSPRAPRQGELVTVTFDESSIASPKTINVVSASGQNVYKTKLPAGQSSINLDTSRLNQGMYVVTVVTDGRSQEAAKIIVR